MLSATGFEHIVNFNDMIRENIVPVKPPVNPL